VVRKLLTGSKEGGLALFLVRAQMSAPQARVAAEVDRCTRITFKRYRPSPPWPRSLAPRWPGQKHGAF
jgi:hypothetical protein